jgi:tRNA(fMet)-specific endonuclease VapC
MIYVLDTNICIYFLNGSFKSIVDEMSSRSAEDLAVTSITVAELYFGAHHSARKSQNLSTVGTFLSDLQILPFDRQAGETFGEMKESLRADGQNLGPYDLLIAAVVRSRNCTLVTHNFKEFSRVPGLLVVDWAQ